ncbi:MULTISPECIES: hypothetical protein [unclassified Phocaeicola]|jgi:hypothetical protein|uniref:hypothetical protein n=1 Tax=unclassified Phocaeicola TaxID=2762211 RepID=UPI000338DBEC|nr:unknown [Bacteroides sp. CAG:1076]
MRFRLAWENFCLSVCKVAFTMIEQAGVLVLSFPLFTGWGIGDYNFGVVFYQEKPVYFELCSYGNVILGIWQKVKGCRGCLLVLRESITLWFRENVSH